MLLHNVVCYKRLDQLLPCCLTGPWRALLIYRLLDYWVVLSLLYSTASHTDDTAMCVIVALNVYLHANSQICACLLMSQSLSLSDEGGEQSVCQF